jgi:hypothetical protein
LRFEAITFHAFNEDEKHRAEDCEVGGAFAEPPTGTLAWWAVCHFIPQFTCDSGTSAACLKTLDCGYPCLSAGEKEDVKLTEAYDLARATLPPKNRSHHAPAMAENTGIRCRVPKGAPRCVLAGQRTPAAEFRRSCLDHAEDYGRPNAPASCHPRAADRVLDYAQHGIETEDIEIRASDLERAADLSKSSGKFSPSEDVPSIHYDERDR